MQPDIDKILADMRTIQYHVEQATGLLSRWNGTVDFTSEVNIDDLPVFIARKEWNCGITLHLTVLDNPGLLGTLIHEMLHSVSVGMTPSSFAKYAGFEEGVIEWFTRQLGPQIASITNAGTPFTQRTAFGPYVEALEHLRAMTMQNDQNFYLQLLQTPLSERHSTVVQWVQNQHPTETTARVLARIAFDLRRLRG